jgi:cytochrome P450
MERLSKKYGPVFTIWLGEIPQVFVLDTKFAVEVFKNKAFAGRPHLALTDHILSKPGTTNIAFSDFSRPWEVLRRVAFNAVRRYANSEPLSYHVVQVTDQIVDRMMKEKDSIQIEPSLSILLLSLLSTSAFGKDYTLEDEELVKIDTTMKTLTAQNAVFIAVGLSPSLRFLVWKKWRKVIEIAGYFRELVGKRYNEHVEDFSPNKKNPDFTDALLWARRQAEIEEEPEVLKYIDEYNIRNAVTNLFFAGSNTTRTSLGWWFLYSALNQVKLFLYLERCSFLASFLVSLQQEHQTLIRKEIEAVLPNEETLPVIEMRDKCPFLMAFTSEVLRCRPVAPFGLPHKTLEESRIGNQVIPSGTTVLSSLLHCMRDESCWKDAKQFNPNRFLEPETFNFIQRPNSFWLPFSTGRRSCIGEKLAMNNMFLIILRFFQKTRGFRYEVTPPPKSCAEEESLLSPNKNMFTFLEPVPYRIRLVPV